MDDVPLTDPEVAPPAPAPGLHRAWLTLGAVVLLLVSALAGAALWGRSGPAPDARPAFAVARPAPVPATEFTLDDLAGHPVHLRDFRGRVVLVNFWATWCPPCREEIPAMQALARDLGPRGLVVLAVNFEEDAATVATFVRETGLSLPVLLDRDGAVASRYGVTALPVTFFVDRRGTLVGSALGFRDWATPGARAYVHGLLTPPG